MFHLMHCQMLYSTKLICDCHRECKQIIPVKRPCKFTIASTDIISSANWMLLENEAVSWVRFNNLVFLRLRRVSFSFLIYIYVENLNWVQYNNRNENNYRQAPKLMNKFSLWFEVHDDAANSLEQLIIAELILCIIYLN